MTAMTLIARIPPEIDYQSRLRATN